MNGRRTQFEQTNIHKNYKDFSDHPERPFVNTSRIEENPAHPIYSCSFNQCLPDGHSPVFATVGGRYAHIYECPLNTNGINLLGSFFCTSKTESLYASTWAFDTYENSKSNNPYMLAVAGLNAYIYVVDTTTQTLVNKLVSHGGPVNELRTCPKNPNLIASASFDKTIRIFHIRNDGCLIVIGGLESHSDQILSLDWSLCGSYIISCGVDHTVLKWNLTRSPHRDTIDKACKILAFGKRNSLTVAREDSILRALSTVSNKREPCKSLDEKRKFAIKDYKKTPEVTTPVMELIETMHKQTAGQSYVPLYAPEARNCDLHLDYVDCVRFFGNSQYIFTKGCGKESVLYMWRFGSIARKDAGLDNIAKIENSSVRLMQKNVPNGETWFIKFDVDPAKKWLACGSNCGTVHFFDLHDFMKQAPTLTVQVGAVPVRQVAFSPTGRVVIAVSDDASVARIDRIHAGIGKIPTFKLYNKNSQKISRVAKDDKANEGVGSPMDKMRLDVRTDLGVPEDAFDD